MHRVRTSCAILATALTSLVAAFAAHADGLPVLGIDVGGVGVSVPGEGLRYVTLPAGANTVVARIASSGEIAYSRLVAGTFTIPAVAYDGSASGLSHDGKTLVLIEPRQTFPRAETNLLVLNAKSLRPRRLVSLHGDYSFDAISPLGSSIYLIQYVSPNDPTRYLVRALGTTSGRFDPKAVVDPREPGEKMRGNPLSRATSTDGRWAYTLYDGAGSTPFVHALDTSARSARCIDLDALAGTDISTLRLRFDSGAHELRVMRGGASVLVVDLRTFKVHDGSSSSMSLGLGAATFGQLALLAAASTVAALSLLWLRRRRS